MKIEDATSSIVVNLWSEVRPAVQAAKVVEIGAQAVAQAICEYFQESVVLSRVFLTVPYDDLPKDNRRFVRRVLKSADSRAELKDTTPVLSLIGSYGSEAGWCDRRKSRDHVGIPMLSSSFVGTVPMVSRLLKELRVPLDWVDSHDSQMIVNAIGSAAGLFYVEDAARAVDAEGRLIIAAPEFVSGHHVHSVFGIGGGYPTGQIAMIVTFCRRLVPRCVAEHFLTLATSFISETRSQVERERRVFIG